jgi:PAS domain S-box-containing protein
MNLELAAAIRADFATVRDRWMEYLVAGDGPYRARPRAELEETVDRGLEAWLQVLEGRNEALEEFVHAIVTLRMSLGFSLAEIHHASIGFRIVVQPLIEQRYTDAVAAVRAYDAVAAVCDRATLLLSEEWQRVAAARLAEAGRENEERTERLVAVSQENRRLAQALSGANSRLRSILGSVDSAILLVDTDWRVAFANARVRDLLGIDPAALIGRDKREAVATDIKWRFKHPDAFEQRLQWLDEHMDEEAKEELEVVSPEPRWLKCYSTPVYDDEDRLVGRLTVYTDITEERRTQEILEDMVFARTREIQELSQRLVQRERLAAIGELAASIAHELRNPLGVIANAGYLLRRKLGSAASDPQFAASAARTVETIENHVQRCSRVITDLLDFARSRPLRQEAIDPAALLRDALREHPIPRQIRVFREVDPAVPRFLGDEPFLQQAISNLIANALRAMSDQEQGELRVCCRPAPGGVEVVVADNGSGMEDEVRERMFEPLFTTSPGGTGLGLPLVKRIVEAHDGRISVDTAPGRGTTITIFLPIRPTEEITTETQRHRE